jgi:hypothetical protein
MFCKKQLWHERLSHINVKYIRNTLKKKAVLGIHEDEMNEEFTCEGCHLGKATRTPFPKKTTKTSLQPGDLIHGDLSGEMKVSSLGGAKYFLLLKYDYPGFLQVAFLKKKSEAGDNVTKFISFMQQ